MTYYIFVENGNLNGAGQCQQLTEGIENIEVSEEVYNLYNEEPEKYIYSAEPIEGVEAVGPNIYPNPEYNTIQAQARENKFNEEFFLTSLGYIRRKVTMKDGSTKDFLTDILPLLQAGVPIISYDKPDFTTGEMPKQNTDKLVTEEFINECKQQVLKDFYGAAIESEE